jgi:hypothetical protein
MTGRTEVERVVLNALAITYYQNWAFGELLEQSSEKPIHRLAIAATRRAFLIE